MYVRGPDGIDPIGNWGTREEAHAVRVNKLRESRTWVPLGWTQTASRVEIHFSDWMNFGNGS